MTGKCSCLTCPHKDIEAVLQEFTVGTETWYLCEACVGQIKKFCGNFLGEPVPREQTPIWFIPGVVSGASLPPVDPSIVWPVVPLNNPFFSPYVAPYPGDTTAGGPPIWANGTPVSLRYVPEGSNWQVSHTIIIDEASSVSSAAIDQALIRAAYQEFFAAVESSDDNEQSESNYYSLRYLNSLDRVSALGLETLQPGLKLGASPQNPSRRVAVRKTRNRESRDSPGGG